MKISEAELERRRKMLRENRTVAGPDHPIYQSGLRILPTLQPVCCDEDPMDREPVSLEWWF